MDIEQRFLLSPLDATQVAAWAVLVAATEAEDHQDEFLGETELSEFLDNPDNDLPRGSLAIYDRDAMAGRDATAADLGGPPST